MDLELDKPDTTGKNFQAPYLSTSSEQSGQQPVETCTRILEVFRGISII